MYTINEKNSPLQNRDFISNTFDVFVVYFMPLFFIIIKIHDCHDDLTMLEAKNSIDILPTSPIIWNSHFLLYHHRPPLHQKQPQFIPFYLDHPALYFRFFTLLSFWTFVYFTYSWLVYVVLNIYLFIISVDTIFYHNKI